MTMCYSVVPGDALIFKLGDILEGCGVTTGVNWSRLDCTDCVWIVPGTIGPDD